MPAPTAKRGRRTVKGDKLPPAAATRPATPRRWRAAAVGLTVFLLTFAVFGRTLGHDFVNWDDPANITLNHDFRGLGPTQLRWMFTTFHMGHYQPLSWITLALDYLWSKALYGDGLKPTFYHLTNNLLHAANAALAYLLIRRLLHTLTPAVVRDPAAARGPGPPGPLDAPGWAAELAAAVAALLFALHPLRVESVAWVTERRDVLSSFFLLLALLAYLRACRSRTTWPRWLALAVVAHAASLLSRAMGVTLPLILLLLDCYPLRRLARRQTGPPGPGLGWLLLEKVPFVILSAAAAITAPLAQRAVGATASLEWHDMTARLAQACYGLVFYLWKTIVPLNLSPIYEIRLPIDISQPRYWGSTLLVVAALIALAAVFAVRRAAWPVVAVAVYVILLAPVSGLVQSGIQEVADRYSYLPSLVVVMLVAAGLSRLWGQAELRLRVAAAACVGLGVAALAVLTWRQCGVWRNTTTLFTYAVAVSPEASAAQNGYGWVLLEGKRYDEALRHLRRAIAIAPTNEKAHNNIWRALREQGKTEELLAAYQESIRVHPNFPQPYYNLGVALQRRGDLQGAADAYLRAVELQPTFGEAHFNLARILASQGEATAAIGHYRAAIAAKPRDAPPRRFLAQLLKQLGRDAEALMELRAALANDPNDATSRELLAQWTHSPAGESEPGR